MNKIIGLYKDWLISNKSSSTLCIYTIFFGGVVAFIGGYFIHQNFKQYKYWKSKFFKAGTVDSLFIYPIKSCKGNKV